MEFANKVQAKAKLGVDIVSVKLRIQSKEISRIIKAGDPLSVSSQIPIAYISNNRLRT